MHITEAGGSVLSIILFKHKSTDWMIDTDTGIRIEKCSKCKGQNQFVSLSSSLVLGTFMVRFFPYLNFDFLKKIFIGLG